jgi:hypothetical protein
VITTAMLGDLVTFAAWPRSRPQVYRAGRGVPGSRPRNADEHQIAERSVSGQHGTRPGHEHRLGSIDGSGSVDYQIYVMDAGEPGTNDTYQIKLMIGMTTVYDSGVHMLDQGNVQIHK